MGDEFWKQTGVALQTALASDPTLSSRELAIRFIVASSWAARWG